MTFLLPINKLTGEQSQVMLPMNILNLSACDINSIQAAIKPAQGLDNPVFLELPQHTLQRVNDPVFGGCYSSNLTGFGQTPALSIVMQDSDGKNYFAGYHAHNLQEEGEYELELNLAGILDLPVSKKTLFRVDFVDQNSSLNPEQVMSTLKNYVTTWFGAGDSVNFMFSGFFTDAVNNNWVSADSASLGQEGENQLFLINIKDEKKEEICKKYNGEFVNLRSILWTTKIEYLEILGLGSSLFGWHKHNQFCANCGNATKIKDMGFSRVCNSCQTEHFPRIDPVAIMLVLKEHKCLFGRSDGFLPNLYSILAGFIEPCETIEQACRREIYEETKIKIGDVKIIGNQPWPFVSQLMIGLEAYALNDEIEINENGIEDAIWLDKEQAKQLLSKHGLMIDGIKKFGPRTHTIANSLVQYWLNQ